ncbi:squamosa promoter-binding-like protein 15 isoform X1 [Zingiber officinale]|uniref:squamosa promoter-binding-like protein 15 isoform X1 n=1 Tax=Zingiber officinale TaxID=94328 RepID=UPI001C4A7F1B|nr:squamosa promoter-binding-like protein 15 isoform X1 [Zingiber officinale]
MEGEVGAQVASPIFFHHHHQDIHDAHLLAKKRDLPWKKHIFQHIQSQESQQVSSLSNSSGNWNPKMWDWDSVRFTATPAPDAADLLCLGSQPSSSAAAVVDPAKKGNEGSNDSKSRRDLEEDNGELTLKLGGGSNLVEEPAGARPSKRVRSGTPATSNSYPMCQVDDCHTDLSCAKDYHRRHKVCEVHSKTTKALVGKQMQRFCQQCSRFHPLSEFDEGKRSCRKRLAGHNRRRRKTQPEDSSSKLLPPKFQENMISGNLDIMKLLSMLSPLKGSYHDKPSGISLPPDRDRLVQLISKLSASISGDPSERATPDGFDLNTCQDAPLGSLEKSIKEAFSAALATSITPVPASLSQGSSKSSGNHKAIVQNADPSLPPNLHNKPTNVYSSVALTSKGISQLPMEVPHHVVQQPHQSLPLQLFGPSDDDNPPAEGFAIKHLSSESSNPTEERSPPSPSPITKKLFPLHSTLEREKYTGRSHYREENATVELSTTHGASATLDFFQNFERSADHVGYKSNYSDHSPSSSNSVQDRTGRIVFKLFGKDPSSFPDALRAQVFNWLSSSPLEMESYIRPGCVILSIYLSMPSIAWEELENDLLQRVTSLIQCSETEFWRNTRFLICTNRQLVSHKDGKIRVSKNSRAWTAPEVTSISPVAVVGGKETSLVLKGRNLTVPGTNIHCTYRGKYMSKEVLCSTYPGTIYDDSCVESFNFPGGFQEQFGRCFIEVENGFKGNSFPIIIANVNICQELRTLEVDFHRDFQTTDASTEDKVSNSPQYRSKKDVLHFLNELGWLFQRTHASSNLLLSDFSISRFKYLLTFSVERDWCTLICTLLDIIVQRSLKDDSLKHEALELLSEVHLLNRAVKRKCKKMVDLLIHYCVVHGSYSTKVYLFPPNMAGPGGITPLHMAASMHDSVDMVDVLTNDPQEIGLKCWNSVLDDNHQSPYMYALSRNNSSYNNLVARKLADRKNGQVTISFEGEKITSTAGESRQHGSQVLESGSCAQCAMTRTVQLRRTPRTGLLQRPYVHSMLAIAAVCVCVCLLLRGSPQTGSADPFRWENLDFGPS